MYTAANVGIVTFSLIYGPNFLFFNLSSIGQLATTSTKLSLRNDASMYGSKFAKSLQ